MGRIFEKRKERMFARWSKMAKAFTKLGKELAIAVKLGGSDPQSNPRLRMAIQTARSLNMPKDRIEGAIKRAIGKEGADLVEIIYEGYGPHKVAMMVSSATDNPTRTVANVRNIFSRWGGNLAQQGAVTFIFDKKGVVKIAPTKDIDLEELELSLIDVGLEELFESDDGYLIYAQFDTFGALQKALEDQKIEIISAGVQMIPNTFVELSEEEAKDLDKLVEALEEDDDVQLVFHNLHV
jgi:YebC/PmpR family DNA-binding regulatory protein